MPTLIRMYPDNPANPRWHIRICNICCASDGFSNKEKRFSLTYQPKKHTILIRCLNCKNIWEEPVGLAEEMMAKNRAVANKDAAAAADAKHRFWEEHKTLFCNDWD